MKKTICVIIICLLLPVLFLSSCGSAESNDKEKLSIVCTGFASYDWISNILGENSGRWELIRLNKNGSDMHSYQPSAADVAAISNCDLLVCTGGISEEWLSRLTGSGSDFNGKVYDMMGSVSQDGHDHGHDDGVCHLDEHIWLSPEKAIALCSGLAEEIISVDASGKEVYEKNLLSYTDKLKSLDAAYKYTIGSFENKILIFADRFPFHYLTEDYGLSYFAAFPGCSAETEASFDTVISLAEKAVESRVPALIITERSDDDIAEAIIKTSGKNDIKIYEMNSLQAVSDKDVSGGLTYIGAMEKNLEVIEKALSR